jgi:hypothetical protein
MVVIPSEGHEIHSILTIKNSKKMKKVLLGAVMLIVVISASAQSYKASFGVNVGSFNGLSYKGFLTDHLVLQVDLGVNLEGTYGQVDLYTDGGVVGNTNGFQSFYTFELNPNLLYQAEIKSTDVASISWFAGGGLNAGFMNKFELKKSYPTFKWGLHGIGGVEFQLAKVPVTFSLDLRPGYGMSTHTLKFEDRHATAVNSFFDWKAVVGIRYVFK